MSDRKSTWAKRLTAIALIVFALLLASQPLQESLAIDSCIDSGGSFDYVTDRCDYETSHPVGPRKSKLYIAGALLSAAVASILFALSSSRHHK